MLILSRKIEEGIRIGDQIEIHVLDVYATDSSGSRKSKVASIGIQAPKDIRILRGELAETQRENKAAMESVQNISQSALADILRKRRTMASEDAET